MKSKPDRVAVPQLALFDAQPLAVVLPDAPPKPKPEFPKRNKECVDCGRKLTGRGWKPGDRCKLCIPPFGDPAVREAGVCCYLRPGAVRCAVGQPCKAIPF